MGLYFSFLQDFCGIIFLLTLLWVSDAAQVSDKLLICFLYGNYGRQDYNLIFSTVCSHHLSVWNMGIGYNVGLILDLLDLKLFLTKSLWLNGE